MTGTLKVTAAISIAMALVACGDKPQAMNPGSASKQDTAAHAGTGSAYMDKGWKAGDKASWEQHLKTRMQNGQNDYAKAN